MKLVEDCHLSTLCLLSEFLVVFVIIVFAGNYFDPVPVALRGISLFQLVSGYIAAKVYQ